MVYKCNYLYLIFIAFLASFTSQVSAVTNSSDVAALKDLYNSLNRPKELERWNLDDPCEQSWKGIVCSGSSVIHIKIEGLNLTGHLGNQLFNLKNLKIFDVSSNKIKGQIPSSLPPFATHIDMACNYLSQNIPQALPMMKRLRHLNLSHNLLSGPIGDVFTGLYNLTEMDLSNNNFTGDLPRSFGSLKNLTTLFLQNNHFTGSVKYLGDLPLTDLNIKNNLFSGLIPRGFQSIPNLRMGSNKFKADGNSPPWEFPLNGEPFLNNISHPPMTQANAIDNHSRKVGAHRKKHMSGGEVAVLVGGVALIVTGAALFIGIRLKQSNENRSDSFEDSLGRNSSFQSYPPASIIEINPQDSSRVSPFNPASLIGTKRLPPLPRHRTSREMSRRSFSRRRTFSGRVKVYTVAELQSATDSFSKERFLGEGSLGAVYRAVLPDGQILALKNINMVGLSFHQEETFLEVVSISSRLRHPNIVPFHGYCMEHGQHLLAYDYVMNLTLHSALHDSPVMPLTWPLRLRVALGVAQALNYMHSSFSPPVAHGNLKSANILLDDDLVPRVTDTGLASLKPLITDKTIRSSELATEDAGYFSPDHDQPEISSTKNDVYAFGVLLLELLTGRKPYDDSRPREEQYLGKWASTKLHDAETLGLMVDPGIQGTISTKTLSRYADIISLCIQPVKEFRPPMSAVVDSLTVCSQKLKVRISTTGDGTDVDPPDKSRMSTHSRFKNSPTLTNISA